MDKIGSIEAKSYVHSFKATHGHTAVMSLTVHFISLSLSFIVCHLEYLNSFCATSWLYSLGIKWRLCTRVCEFTSISTCANLEQHLIVSIVSQDYVNGFTAKDKKEIIQHLLILMYFKNKVSWCLTEK